MALKPYRSTAHWKKIRVQVLRRDAYQCTYCGNEATEVDHIWPKARGGEDTLDNLVAACKPCNIRERDLFRGKSSDYHHNWNKLRISLHAYGISIFNVHEIYNDFRGVIKNARPRQTT